jgi:hypothetical protein
MQFQLLNRFDGFGIERETFGSTVVKKNNQ